VATACALAWRSDSPLVPRHGGNVTGTAPLFLALLIAAFALYALALLLIRRTPPSLRAVIILAAAIQLVPLAAPLLLSTDAWTYWSYGWIGSHGSGNPYADPPQEFPDSPALPYMGSDWLDTTSVYGPAFTAASEPLAVVAGDSENIAAWTYKTLAAAAALGAALLAGRIARRKALAIALVGWNPVLAVHLAGGGHNDAWVGALILAALALSGSRRAESGGVLWIAAIAVKWVPILFLALRSIESRAATRPLATRGLVGAAAVVALGATVLYGGAWPLAIFPLAGNAALETSYAIPHRLEQLGLPDDLALALAIAALGAGLIALVRSAAAGRARLGLAACLVLVTTPYLAVWYLAWAVPLAAAEEDTVATVGVLVLCAYLLPQTIPI
jgi:hypothetical protein